MEEDIQKQNYQTTDILRDQEYSNQFYYSIFDQVSIEESYPQESVLQISPVSTAQLRNISSKNQIDKFKQNRETKNITAFYSRAICDYVLSQQGLPAGIKRKLQKKKAALQNANIGSLKSILSNKLINSYAKQYITSFNFLNQILTANKLQDVRPVIKYCSKLLEAIEDPLSFNTWK